MPCIQCNRTIIEPTVVCKHCGKYKVTSNIKCPNCGKHTNSVYETDPQSKLPIVYAEDNYKMCLLCYVCNMMELPNVAFNPYNILIPNDSKNKPYYYDVYQKEAVPVITPPKTKPITTSNNFSILKSMDPWR